MKKILLFNAILLTSLLVFSQKKKETEPKWEPIEDAIKIHKEFDIDDTEFGFKVIPVEKQGVVLAYMPDAKETNGFKDFVFKKYDISFNEEFETNVTVNKDYKIIDYQLDNEDLYVLFANDKNARKIQILTTPYFKDYLIVKLNLVTKELKTTTGILEKALHLKQIIAKNGIVSLTGRVGPTAQELNLIGSLSMCLCYIPMLFYVPNYKPYVVTFNMKNKSIIKKEYLMENYGKGISELLDADQHDSLDEIVFTVKHKLKKTSSLTIRSIKSGKLLPDYNIKTPDNIEVFKGKINYVNDENKILVGTYGEVTGKKFNGENRTQGIYVSNLNKNKLEYFKIIPWTKFKNFRVATTASEDRAIERSNKTGKTANILMQVIFHDPIIKDEEIVFFGETYYPQYKVTIEETTDARTGRVISTRRITEFIGYQYSGTLVFAINEAGELLWDDGFNVNGPLTFFLKERFKFYETDDNSYTVIYNEGSSLNMQTINKEDNTRKRRYVDMSAVAKKGDKITSSYSNADVEYWYDDFYIASGRVDVKNKKEKGKNKKKNVFYLNKVELPLYDTEE